MNLPTTEEIEQLWKEFAVPANIQEHMKQVAGIVVKIARKFDGAGIEINVELVEKSCLLHDLVRVCDFQSFEPNYEHGRVEVYEEDIKVWKRLREKYEDVHHSDAACSELKDKYPELAEVICKHKYQLVGEENGPQTWEEKIVNYADKRVVHDKIASLEERRQDAIKRYQNHKYIKVDNRHKQLQELEDEIFSKIDMKPEDIK